MIQKVIRIFFLVCFICLISAVVYANDIKVSVSEVTDTRTTGQFFSGIELKLKVMGDVIADAKGLKLRITKAVDDTGRNLLKEEKERTDFDEPDEYNIGQAEVRVKLKNPARKAAVIKDLIGEISLFVPKNDPNAIAIINKFMTQTGKTLSNTVLKASGLEVAVLTKSQYEEIKTAKEKEVKDGTLAKEFGEAMIQAFSSLFGGMMEIGENSVILHVKDPESKVVAIEFIDISGEKIKHISSMKMGDVKVFEFEKPIPQDAKITIYIATSKSLIMTALKLTDIALP